MRRSSLALLAFPLLAAGLLPACVPTEGQRPAFGPQSLAAGGPTPAGHRVGVLVPLTGPQASLGQDLLKAVQLGVGADGPAIDLFDTAGTPDGAAAGARNAVAAHDEIIVGPLTNVETAAAAGAANGIPILAFTSDAAQAKPGVWPLGITADQQVRRLVRAAQAENKTRFAAALPDNALGVAVGDALTRATSEAGAAPATVRRYAGGFTAANSTLKDLSDYANRRGGIEARVKAARASSDPDTKARAADIAKEPVPAAPFDALVLSDPHVGALLPPYDIAPPDIRILGAGPWARDSIGLSGLTGAWYAAPDPAARAGFVQAFNTKYGSAPPAIADIAFDAASVARVLASQGGALTRPQGFAGADGVFGLLPDGHVRRNLALFEIGSGGAHIADPAAPTLQAPNS